MRWGPVAFPDISLLVAPGWKGPRFRTTEEVFVRPKSIAILVLVVLALIVVFSNTDTVRFRFLFWTAYISQLLLVLIMLVVGFVVGYATSKLRKRS